jgi:phosphoribosylanthranilate isomerase
VRYVRKCNSVCSGQTFDWEILNKYKLNVPFFLSGGLSADNLEEVMKIKHPAFYGVDLNSRFELSPGLKDIDKLTQAFNTINSNEVRS